MKYIIFDHAARAWVNSRGQPVASIFDAAVFDSEDAALGHFRGRTWDWEVCPWQGA